jgi:cell division protein FtsB
MAAKKMQDEESATGAVPDPIPRRALSWSIRVWRPAGSVIALGLALLLGWHVFSGKNGLSVWYQKQAEDRQLQREINDLQKENAHLRQQIERLKSNPDAIEQAARERLHYAKPGEVIVALPAQPKSQTMAGAAK